jgi:TRAP-type C4-dicarboxylate transport system permease small subunit
MQLEKTGFIPSFHTYREVSMLILLRIEWLLRKLSYLGFLVASFLLLLVGVMGTLDVISTNLFYQPIPGMVELSGALLGVIVFLGLAEAQARGSHIVIDVAISAMGPRLNKFAVLFSLTVGIIFMGTVAWQTTELALRSLSYNEKALGALAFPLPPFKGLAAFGAWLSAAEFARQFVIRLVTPATIDTTPKDPGPKGEEHANA